ncbi:MAG: hypothetical protein L3J04_06485, partial [Robiginitomaculum sp.]|nr:hypothetical protein [Robiginitomaculum sp.]
MMQEKTVSSLPGIPVLFLILLGGAIGVAGFVTLINIGMKFPALILLFTVPLVLIFPLIGLYK